MGKKALFLTLSKACYGSTFHFSQKICAELVKAGWQVDIIEVDKPTAFQKKVVESERSISWVEGFAMSSPVDKKSFDSERYDVVFEINVNSEALENCDFDYEKSGKATWHMILDHPMYHHKVLSRERKHFHVICIDRKHAAYVEKYYPHVESVHFMPLGADAAAKWIPYETRKHKVLFTGTYTSSAQVKKEACETVGFNEGFFEEMTAKLLEHPAYTQEEALLAIIKEKNPAIAKPELMNVESDLPDMLHTQYYFDMYIRCMIREEMLMQVLKSGITVDVYGHNWELFEEYIKMLLPQDGCGKLICHGEVPYEKLPSVYANTCIALNVMPWFKDGMHDRIPLAMLNGCVAISDESPYLEECLQEGEQILLYSLECMDEVPKMVHEVLENVEAGAKIAAKGYAYASGHFTWRRYVRELVKMIEG